MEMDHIHMFSGGYLPGSCPILPSQAPAGGEDRIETKRSYPADVAGDYSREPTQAEHQGLEWQSAFVGRWHLNMGGHCLPHRTARYLRVLAPSRVRCNCEAHHQQGSCSPPSKARDIVGILPEGSQPSNGAEARYCPPWAYLDLGISTPHRCNHHFPGLNLNDRFPTHTNRRQFGNPMCYPH